MKKTTKVVSTSAAYPPGTHATSESNTDKLVHLLEETLDELKGH